MRLQDELQRREDELRRKEELFRQQQRELQRHRQEDMYLQVSFFILWDFCIHPPSLGLIISGFFVICILLLLGRRISSVKLRPSLNRGSLN